MTQIVLFIFVFTFPGYDKANLDIVCEIAKYCHLICTSLKSFLKCQFFPSDA